MAANEKFTFTDPDSGEQIYECKARQGALNRAKLYLFKGGEPNGNYETNLWLGLWGFLSAHAAGHDVVEMPANMRKVNADMVLDWMDQVTVDYEVEMGEDAAPVEDGNENPTDTSGEFSLA